MQINYPWDGYSKLFSSTPTNYADWHPWQLIASDLSKLELYLQILSSPTCHEGATPARAPRSYSGFQSHIPWPLLFSPNKAVLFHFGAHVFTSNL